MIRIPSITANSEHFYCCGQLQHNMWVVAARTAVLSVITGGGKWVEITAHADALARATPGRNGQSNGQRSRSFANGKGRSPARPPALTPEESAAARDRLIAVLNELGSGDEAASWAQRTVAEKNTLTDGDARAVEEAFEQRLAGKRCELPT
jgi:hypothetical protein